MNDFRLTKDDKLCSKTKIDLLFSCGKSFMSYPYRIVYSVEEGTDSHVDMFISVPKRNFKRAVKRNLIRRKSKEAYRLNKSLLLETAASKNFTLHIAFLYISKQIEEYAFIEKKMKESLKRLAETILTPPKPDI